MARRSYKGRHRRRGTKTTRRGRRGMGEPNLGRKGRKGRKRSRSRGMGDFLSPQGWKHGLSYAGWGGAGGFLYGIADKGLNITGMKVGYRVGIGALGAIVLSTMGNAPKMGAGFAGAVGHQLSQELFGGMSEGHEYVDPNVMASLPDATDEEGQPMYLSEDGNAYYAEEIMDDPELSEEFADRFDLSDEDDLAEAFDLSEQNWGSAGMYPGLVQTGRF